MVFLCQLSFPSDKFLLFLWSQTSEELWNLQNRLLSSIQYLIDFKSFLIDNGCNMRISIPKVDR